MLSLLVEMWETKGAAGAVTGPEESRTASALQGLVLQSPVRQHVRAFLDPHLCPCVRPWGCQVGVAEPCMGNQRTGPGVGRLAVRGK